MYDKILVLARIRGSVYPKCCFRDERALLYWRRGGRMAVHSEEV